MPNETSASDEAKQPLAPRPPQKPASMAVYKRELRREIKRRQVEPEINFLNITAMMDMMTIILVFLLKSMSSSSASLPQSSDLKMAKSVLTTEASESGLSVVISKSQIVVDDHPVVPVPALPATSIEAKYKRGGSNDLEVVPLSSAAQSWRERDKQIRAAMGRDANTSEAIIIADAQTPFRILTEVLYTLGNAEYGKFHMMVLQGAGKK